MNTYITTSKRQDVARQKQSVPVSPVISSSLSPVRRFRFVPFGVWLPALVPATVLLLLWYFVTANGLVNSLLLPKPEHVLLSLSDGLLSGTLITHAWITVQESISGFLLAVLLALPLGYGVAKVRWLAQMLQPYLAAGQAIPAIVLAPFLYIWLGGQSILPVVVVCMLVVLFPLVINTILGLQTIEREVLEAARVEGASGGTLLTAMELPLAMPAIMAAIRTCLTLSIMGAVVGEFVCSPDRGLGGLVQMAMNQYNMPFLFASVIVMALLAAFYYAITGMLMKLVQRIY